MSDYIEDGMTEGADLLAAHDGTADFVAALSGLRAQLVRDGWTDEQARDLIVAMWQTNARGAEA